MSFFRFLKHHKKKTIFFVLLLAGVGWGAYSFRPMPVPYEFVEVESRNIIQQVSVTGSVTPNVSVDLAFEASGKVTSVFADVGDVVVAGQPLVALDDANISANLEQARAAVDAAEARLSELLTGTREEEIAVQKVTLANTQRAYANAQNSVLTSAENAYTSTDDAIRNKVDKFFLDPRSADPEITLLLNSFGLETTLKSQRVDMETMLSDWKKENDIMEVSLVDINTAPTAKRHLLQVRTFLDNCALALSIAIPNGSITQTIIDGYKTDISTSRSAINAAISALETAGDALSSTKSSVDLQASNLALAEAPALPETILAQQAAIEQAEANVRSLQATLSKTVLKSPIKGTVTMQNAKRGIIVTPGTPIVTVISKDQLKVEAFIPEADIAKVKLEDIASTTLDAYGDAVDFPVKVVSVDPAQTVIEGVATYKTTFDFIKSDVRIKPGMTANIDILTEQKNGVPSLPQRVLIRRDAKVFAQTSKSLTVVPDVLPVEIPIVMGLRGSDGYTEIVSGLQVGDKVIVPKN